MTRQIIHLSAAAFHEIADELVKAGCLEAVILESDHSITLDMHGICFLRKVEDVVGFTEDVDIMTFNPDILQGFE